MFTIKSIEGKTIKFDITDEITKVEYSPYGYISYDWKEVDISKKSIDDLEYSTCYVIKYTFKKDNIECIEMTDYITTLSELDDVKRQLSAKNEELDIVKNELDAVKKALDAIKVKIESDTVKQSKTIKDNEYTKYLNLDWSKLIKLPKLSIDEISEYENDLCKMCFYAFYGYIDKLSEYSIIELKRPININNDNLYLMCSYNGQIEIMEYLEKKGINIHIKDNFGYNAYLVASSRGQIDIMKYLEDKGFDIHIKNNYGYNVYDLASLNKNTKMMKYLEEKGFGSKN